MQKPMPKSQPCQDRKCLPLQEFYYQRRAGDGQGGFVLYLVRSVMVDGCYGWCINPVKDQSNHPEWKGYDVGYFESPDPKMYSKCLYFSRTDNANTQPYELGDWRTPVPGIGSAQRHHFAMGDDGSQHDFLYTQEDMYVAKADVSLYTRMYVHELVNVRR
jgi:hypothetical protein